MKTKEEIESLAENKFNNKNIEIGFHAHDNCCNATCKALYSLKFGQLFWEIFLDKVGKTWKKEG